MNALTFEEMCGLTEPELVDRMDAILKMARVERAQPNYIETVDLDPYVGQLFRTIVFRNLPNDKLRPAIWKTFDLIAQMEYVRAYSGFQNSLPLPQSAGEPRKSPRHLIPFLAQQQAAIVGARIVLERFIDLVHYLATRRELKGSSKFESFKNWLFSLPVDSNWFYLLPQLPWLRLHDKNFRSAEVHSGSKLKQHLVTLQNISSETQNEAVALHNLLINLWRNILPILDGKKAYCIGGYKFGYDVEWMKHYYAGSTAELAILKVSVERELQALKTG